MNYFKLSLYPTLPDPRSLQWLISQNSFHLSPLTAFHFHCGEIGLCGSPTVDFFLQDCRLSMKLQHQSIVWYQQYYIQKENHKKQVKNYFILAGVPPSLLWPCLVWLPLFLPNSITLLSLQLFQSSKQSVYQG